MYKILGIKNKKRFNIIVLIIFGIVLFTFYVQWNLYRNIAESNRSKIDGSAWHIQTNKGSADIILCPEDDMALIANVKGETFRHQLVPGLAQVMAVRNVKLNHMQMVMAAHSKRYFNFLWGELGNYQAHGDYTYLSYRVAHSGTSFFIGTAGTKDHNTERRSSAIQINNLKLLKNKMTGQLIVGGYYDKPSLNNVKRNGSTTKHKQYFNPIKSSLKIDNVKITKIGIW